MSRLTRACQFALGLLPCVPSLRTILSTSFMSQPHRAVPTVGFVQPPQACKLRELGDSGVLGQ